jgi:hypothetical protein
MSLADIRKKLTKIENDTFIHSKNMMVSVTLKDGTKSVTNFTNEIEFSNFVKSVKEDTTIQSYYISYSEKMEMKDG